MSHFIGVVDVDNNEHMVERSALVAVSVIRVAGEAHKCIIRLSGGHEIVMARDNREQCRATVRDVLDAFAPPTT